MKKYIVSSVLVFIAIFTVAKLAYATSGNCNWVWKSWRWIYECSTPTPTPSPTPVVTASPSPTPTPSATPSGSPEPSETPTPSETPESTPSATPTPEVRVETPLTEAGAPTCDKTAPAKVPNIFVTNAGVGKLEVRWTPTGGTFAHIFYGAEVGKPQHSLLNTSNDGVEVIGSLNSGEHYWFAVTQGEGCAWSSLSDWYDPIVE